MSIEAFCPNGHRILCPDDSLGRAARCPKCSTPFRIGAPPAAGAATVPAAAATAGAATESAAAESAQDAGADTEISSSVPATVEGGVNETAGSEAAAAGSKIGSHSKIGSDSKPSGAGSSKQLPATPAEPKPGSIVFLCPNGHRLNGPEKLAGRLGQCPHCNTKFQIPPLDVIRAAQSGQPDNMAALEEVQFPDSDDGSGMGTEIAEVEDAARLQQEDPRELERMLASLHVEQTTSHPRPASGINILGSAINKVASKLTGSVGSSIGSTTYQIGSNQHTAATQQHAEPAIHPLADLVMRLWVEREHGGIIELHLEGGNVLLPDWFEQRLSLRSHGLFAGQAADGTVTMTVVPWDSVERVVIRGVVGLPDGMFE
jgi:hypothetical protein